MTDKRPVGPPVDAAQSSGTSLPAEAYGTPCALSPRDALSADEWFIRPADIEDSPALLWLHHELQETHRLHHPGLFPAAPTRDSASIERSLADSRIVFFVADFGSTDARHVGAFVKVVDTQTPGGSALVPRRFALVDELVVSPAHRRLGVASRLITAAEQWAVARGIPALEVNVWAFNHAAQDLYAQHGFSTLRRYLRKVLTP